MERKSNVQRFNPAFEVALVQQPGLAPAVKELVVFDRIGDHVEITGTSSSVPLTVYFLNVRRRLLPTFSSMSTNASELSELPTSIELHTEPTHTNQNYGLPNRHCIPISTVFERFRNMPAANVESDSMSRLVLASVGKRLLSNTFSPCVPVDRSESLSPLAECISVTIRREVVCISSTCIRFRISILSATSLESFDHVPALKVAIRKNTQSLLVARAEEALSNRTVNIDRKRKNTSPLLAIHPEDALFTRSIRRRYTPATSNICRASTNRNSPFTNIQNLSSNTAHARNDTPSYMDLGECDQQYTPATTNICRANINRNSLSTNIQNLSSNTQMPEVGAIHDTPSYMDLGGQIYMPLTPDPPAFIQQLFKNIQFMEHILAYNHMFAMTSFGAKIDHPVNKGWGPYVFKISGQIYHWIGSLCPEEGHRLRFLQLYVYDIRDELSNIMHHFGGLDESTLNPEIVEGLIHVLN
ncbi:hypothetical protein Tco_0751927 [Tanacetum coccineum]|uniref:Helitron helicase-like domain-containing protein n=1 Tax=Tanacetum coccineum TaxID=301880 RepID=A0ABQ4Z6N0_9ASTR